MRGDSCRGRARTYVCVCVSSVVFGAMVAIMGMDPVSVSAGPHVPFSVSGTILTIDAGDVKQAGQSGRFIVRDRHIMGTLTGSIEGAGGIPFVITYDSNVSIATQS